MKRNFKQNINEIKRLANNLPKTLNEVFNFNEEGGYPQHYAETEQGYDEEPQSQEIENIEGEEMGQQSQEHEMNNERDSFDVEGFVDDIRKKSLKGMAMLADNPDDERYQLLKKIWQICDKKPEQQTAFSNPNGQQIPPKKM